MHNEQVGRQAVRQGHGRPHAGKRWVLTGLAADLGVDLAVTLPGSPDGHLRQFVVQPHDPVRLIQHQFNQGADSNPAGHLAPFLASHTVGHDHAIDGFHRLVRHFARREVGCQDFQVAPGPGDQEVVLVAETYFSPIGHGSNIDTNLR